MKCIDVEYEYKVIRYINLPNISSSVDCSVSLSIQAGSGQAPLIVQQAAEVIGRVIETMHTQYAKMSILQIYCKI
ncbi:MAG: hypothetical protein LBE97_01950 [Holosporales bacterium]|jgi:hypothetical protein|nr:hypothetical protein [Holosporales bacterium]